MHHDSLYPNLMKLHCNCEYAVRVDVDLLFSIKVPLQKKLNNKSMRHCYELLRFIRVKYVILKMLIQRFGFHRCQFYVMLLCRQKLLLLFRIDNNNNNNNNNNKNKRVLIHA